MRGDSQANGELHRQSMGFKLSPRMMATTEAMRKGGNVQGEQLS